MRRGLATLLLSLLLAGCSAPDAPPPTAATGTTTTTTTTTTPATAPTQPTVPTPPPGEPAPTTAPVTFRFAAPPGVDEVDVRFPVFWGPQRSAPARMAQVDGRFEATVELPLGALVRYEYSVPAFDYEHREQFAPGESVNRHVVVDGPLTVEDAAYAFEGVETARSTTLSGRVTDARTGEPVLEAFVVADGILAGTMDGHYEVDVRDRPLLLTVFTPDGSHRAVTLAAEPGVVDVRVEPAPAVRVRIEADATPPPHHEVRVFATAAQVTPQYLIGNLLTAEVHRTLEDGALELDLHEGQWVDYLYSVGNTVLSHEHDDGAWVVRGFAARDGLVLRDEVGPFLRDDATWFNVTVPGYTGASDVVTLRKLDPRLLVMHPAGEGRWTLAVSGRDLEGAPYRYAKTWAGVGDELTFERTVQGRQVDDVVAEWKLHDGPATWTNETIPPVQNPFRVVVTLPDWYSHDHALALPQWLRNISDQGYHGVVLNSVWGYAPLEPSPRIARTGPGSALHMPASEVVRATRLAHDLGLTVQMEQQLVGAGHLLAASERFDEAWWHEWLVQIERFNVQTARLAQEAGIESVILVAAQPGMDYAPSFAAEYDAGMEGVIAAMREVYDGEIVASPDEFRTGPLDYWNDADRLTQVTYDLRMPADATQEEVDAWVADLLDTRYKAQGDAAGLPMAIKFGVQSTRGALAGTQVPEAQGPATEVNEQVQPLGHEDQLKAYRAFFRLANERPWLAEMNVWVYGPTDAPQTRDVDVRAKPAGALAAAWARAVTEAGGPGA